MGNQSLSPPSRQIPVVADCHPRSQWPPSDVQATGLSHAVTRRGDSLGAGRAPIIGRKTTHRARHDRIDGDPLTGYHGRHVGPDGPYAGQDLVPEHCGKRSERLEDRRCSEREIADVRSADSTRDDIERSPVLFRWFRRGDAGEAYAAQSAEDGRIGDRAQGSPEQIAGHGKLKADGAHVGHTTSQRIASEGRSATSGPGVHGSRRPHDSVDQHIPPTVHGQEARG